MDQTDKQHKDLEAMRHLLVMADSFEGTATAIAMRAGAAALKERLLCKPVGVTRAQMEEFLFKRGYSRGSKFYADFFLLFDAPEQAPSHVEDEPTPLVKEEE